MSSFATFSTIKLSSIHFSDRWNLHPFVLPGTSSAYLIESIKRVGLLQPILLQEKSNNTHRLICGRSRLNAFQATHSDHKAIPCLLLKREVSPETVLSYVLEDQLLSGPLTAMEKAFFFSYCLDFMDIQDAAERFLPILNEKSQPHTIKKLIKLLTLKDEIQLSIHNDTIGEKIAHELLKIGFEDRQAIYTCMVNLKLGGGKQKRFLSLCKNLAYRENISITQLLSKPEFKLILELPEGNQPQKAAMLLASMQKLLFPQSDSAEVVFRKKVTTMNLPEQCTITHSISFETDSVSLTVQFKDFSEMEKQLQTIRALTDKQSY